jgi:hypothetical protein
VNEITEIDSGFFIAQRLPDGSPGRPVGNSDGAMSLFEDLSVARKVKEDMEQEVGPLAIFRLNVVYCGEVVAQCQEN